MKRNYVYKLIWTLTIASCIAACEEEEYKVPQPKSGLQNDAIKRSLGPNLVGLNMEFAYAMALRPEEGTLRFARVEASIPGAAGTRMENNAYYTNGSGVDVPVLVGDPSTTEGTLTQVGFNRDTSAVTLRYFYTVPPEAKGQKVSFKFSAEDSQGRTVSYPLGPYTISSVDIALDITVANNTTAYLSIEDMAAYDAATAAANPGKIDLVYLYRVVNRTVSGTPNTNVFAHALVAPSADPQYLPSVTLPAGVTRNTKIRETWSLRDFHLARTQASNNYVDDIDFQKLDISTAPNYAVNMKADGGAWVETEDGKYRAYIYVNAVNTAAGGSMRISMKRYTMF